MRKSVSSWATLTVVCVSFLSWTGPLLAQNLDECTFPGTVNPADGVTQFDSLDVTDSVTITEANIFLDITTGFVGDWSSIGVQSPSGTAVTLHAGGGGFSSDFNVNYSDVGAANTGVPGAEGDGVPSPYDCGGCLVQPAGPGTLGDFDGEDSLGLWDLSYLSFDMGTLNGWCVRNFAIAPVDELACSTLVDTDADDVPDAPGAPGEFSVTFVASADYDSIEIQSGGVAIVTLGPTVTGTTVYADNVGAALATPQLASLSIIGFVGADSSAPNQCSVPLPAAPIATASETPSYPIDGASPPYLGILEFPAADADLVIADVQVAIDVTYPFVGQLEIAVGSNSGTSVVLHDLVGDFSSDINAIYWDLGIPNGTGTPLVAGTSTFNCGCFMQPSGPGALADFVGEEVGNPVGGEESTAWTIAITTLATDAGVVNEVGIAIFDEGPAFPPLVDSCEADGLNGAEVTWTNGSDYGSINILVNGSVVLTDTGTLFDLTAGAANATILGDFDVPSNTTIGVQGVTAGGAAGPVGECSVALALPPITALSCVSSSGTGTVELSWTNGFAYDEIDILINGALDSTIGGGATTASLPGPFPVPSTVVIDLVPRAFACSGAALDPCEATRTTCSTLVLGTTDIEACTPAPTLGASGTVIAEIVVLDVLTVEDVEILQDSTSTFVSDDDMEIASPAGTQVRLHDFGGPTTLSAQLLVWDDVDGIPFDATSLDCACAMQTQGPGNLADFNGESTSGTWEYTYTAFETVNLNLVCVRIDGCPTLAPSELTADITDEDTGEITLNWTNEGAYDEITVLRDGAVIATLGGGVTSYVDTVDPIGRYAYRVSGFNVAEDCGGSSPAADVTIGINETCVSDVALGSGTLEIIEISVLDPIQIADVELVFDYSNTWTMYQLELQSPSGTEIAIWPFENEVDLSTNGNNLDVIFGDAGAPIPFASPFPAGALYAPNGPGEFGDFQFEVSDGDWILSHQTFNAGATLNLVCVAIYEGCTVPPPSELAGTVVDNDVEWTWTNNGTYTAIDVEINGDVVATIGGTETSYTQEAATAGFYVLRLLADADDGAGGCITGSGRTDPLAKGVFEECSPPDLVIGPAPATDTITVVGGPDSVDEVQAVLQLTHTWIGDLEIDITNPVGTSVRLHQQQTGVENANIDVVYVNSGAPNVVGANFQDGSEVQPFSLTSGADAGMDELLDDIDPAFPDGVWELFINDINPGFDSGTLDNWCVRLFEGCPIGRPDGLTCENTDGFYPVTLSWTNNDSYDSINILRNGVLVDTLAGTAESYVDGGTTPAAGGDFEYRVVALSTADDCSRASLPCTTSIGRRDICDSPALAVASTGFSLTTIDWEAEDLRLADTDGGDSVDIEEVQVLLDITTTFIGDWDVQVFSPEGTGVLLLDNNGADFSIRVVFDDDGQPASGLSLGNALTDPPTQFAPGGLGASMSNFDGENAEGLWQLVAFTFSPGTVNEWCVNVFPDDIIGAGETFVRGDADGNGVFSALLDALRILDFAFGSAPEPPCFKAADADGNGAFNALLDALRILDFAFGSAAAPPAPFPDCGSDLGGLSDTLSCETPTVCP